ncbi:MAG: carboxymuconolactone decarboxylase family protein [Sulfurifustis sp.]
MQQRIDYKNITPGAYQALAGLERYVRASGLERSLLELVKTRVSQINGCAHCLDMHTKDARAAGESEQRLYVLPAWREAPFYTGRERAALAWAEALTLISTNAISDDLYAEVRRHFTEKEIVDLTLAVVAINGWNRVVVSFRIPAGTYEPPAAGSSAASSAASSGS